MSDPLAPLQELARELRNEALAEEVESSIAQDKLQRGQTLTATTTSGPFVSPKRKCATRIESLLPALEKAFAEQAAMLEGRNRRAQGADGVRACEVLG